MKKNTVRKAAQRAISLIGKECIDCGSTKSLQRHHPDHDKALDVVILCQPCHVKAEQETGTWGSGPRTVKVCPICDAEFTNYSHIRVKTCSRGCLSELGRRNAMKRWHPE